LFGIWDKRLVGGIVHRRGIEENSTRTREDETLWKTNEKRFVCRIELVDVLVAERAETVSMSRAGVGEPLPSLEARQAYDVRGLDMSGNASEESKAIAREFLRMFELGDPSMADKIVASDYYNHDAADPSLGLEGVKAFVTTFKNAMPDAQVDIVHQVAEGDRVVSRYTWSGTHQGELFGVPAAGKHVSWTQTTTFRIADGKIREAWTNWDQWGVMQQLGVVPTPGQD
jgi:steroid delta-isomerase-like uncharacterized protein